MFPKIQSFFGILKLALCAVPLGKSLTVGRSIPPGSISLLGLFLEKSSCWGVVVYWSHIEAVPDWQTDWLTNGPTDWVTNWLSDWLTNCLTD